MKKIAIALSPACVNRRTNNEFWNERDDQKPHGWPRLSLSSYRDFPGILLDWCKIASEHDPRRLDYFFENRFLLGLVLGNICNSINLKEKSIAFHQVERNV